jgi:hypothetical protein
LYKDVLSWRKKVLTAGMCLSSKFVKIFVKYVGHVWENVIWMDLKEIDLEGLDWIHLTQDRDKWQALVDMVKHLQVLWSGGNFLRSGGFIY